MEQSHQYLVGEGGGAVSSVVGEGGGAVSSVLSGGGWWSSLIST